MSQSIADLRAEVHAVAIQGNGEPEEEFVGKVLVHRVHVLQAIYSTNNIRFVKCLRPHETQKIPVLRRLVRKLKGKDPDYIYGGP